MMGRDDKKMFYFFIGCICLSLAIVGATYAYFTAKVSNNNVVHGAASFSGLSLSVEKVTTADMAFGLIPMKNIESVNSVKGKCLDDYGNAGCQIYRITVGSIDDVVMFVDGYIEIHPRDQRLAARFARVYTDDNEANFTTKFTVNDFVNNDNLRNDYDSDIGIKTGVKGIRSLGDSLFLNQINDVDCLFAINEQLDESNSYSKVFYVMLWVYDNGAPQDYLQGMHQAYTGVVTVVSAQGNEISASFD